MASRSIYVLSSIPRLAYTLQEALHDVKIIDLKLKEINGSTSVTNVQIDALKDAEILLVDNNIFTQVIDKIPKVKWVQGTWAGVEKLVDYCKDKEKPTFPFTRMTNEKFSQLIAEYALGWIISHERAWLQSRQNQAKSLWIQDGQMMQSRSLQEITVGVLGMGIIGKQVARNLKALRSKVHAYTRTKPSPENTSLYVDKYWHTGQLPLLLKECDYIVNIMPSTPATKDLLGHSMLSHAKDGAALINIGRGNVISDKDLISALDAEWISAAILDVFNEEPLPKDSPLWLHPKVVITPHTAGVSRAQDVTQCFIDNYKRYIAAKPFVGVLSWNDGY